MKGIKDVHICLSIYFTLIFVLPYVISLRITLESATKLLNQTFVVLCKDEAGQSVTWRGPKGLLGLKTRPYVQTSSYGTAIVFNQTVAEDAGTYVCSAGNEKRTFNLTIETPLTFMDTDMTQNGIEGKDVTLRCEVRGGNVIWSVEDGNISDKDKFTVMGDGLLIKNVNRNDSKTYICSAIQMSTGMVVDRKIKLRVLHKPVFPLPTYAQHEQAYGYINGTVNLTCIVIADPSPRFEWHRSSSDRNNKQLIGRIFNISNDISILQLHITDRKTFGEYKCVATNPYGRLEKHFSLDEGFKPSPPASIILRDANSKLLDLVIHGPKKTTIRTNDIENEIPGMETIGYRLQYRDVESGDWQMVDFNVTIDNSYQLEDLTPSTKYAIRAATRNPAGLSDYSNVYTFHTLNSAINFNYLTTSQQFILIIMNFSVIYTSRFFNNIC